MPSIGRLKQIGNAYAWPALRYVFIRPVASGEMRSQPGRMATGACRCDQSHLDSHTERFDLSHAYLFSYLICPWRFSPHSAIDAIEIDYNQLLSTLEKAYALDAKLSTDVQTVLSTLERSHE